MSLENKIDTIDILELSSIGNGTEDNFPSTSSYTFKMNIEKGNNFQNIYKARTFFLHYERDRLIYEDYIVYIQGKQCVG